MKMRVAVVGIAVTYVVLAAPAPLAAQGGVSAERVEPFTHLTAPRVEPGVWIQRYQVPN